MYIPITIKDIEQKLEKQHGNQWPKFALYRFSELKEMIETHKIKDQNVSREYQVLREWLVSMIELGIEATKMSPC